MKHLLYWLLLPAALHAQEPRITALTTGTDAEFRGLHVVDDQVIWASGSGGRYVRSTNGGRTWEPGAVPGADALFFIDVHAFAADTAVLVGTRFEGGEARMYRTTDGGRSWHQAWALEHPNVFLDGAGFWDARRGLVFGDPVDGAFFVLRTDDGGQSWQRVEATSLPAPLTGEAAFAASGTALATAPGGHAWFGTGGGAHARVYRTTDYGQTWQVSETPFAAGERTGIFGLAFADSLDGIAVGGDYGQPTLAAGNVLRTIDGGVTWTMAGSTLPPGVKYGVARQGPRLLAPAPAGTAWSNDGGASWRPLTLESYNTAAFAPGGTAWLAGVKGGLARVDF